MGRDSPLEHPPAPAIGAARGEGCRYHGYSLVVLKLSRPLQTQALVVRGSREPRMRPGCASLSQSPFALVQWCASTQRMLKGSREASLCGAESVAALGRQRGVVTVGEPPGLASMSSRGLSDSHLLTSAWWAPAGERVRGQELLLTKNSSSVFSSKLLLSDPRALAPLAGCSPGWAWPPFRGAWKLLG